MHEFINYKTKLKPETLEELSLTEFEWLWNEISRYQVLPEQFMEKHADKLNWRKIAEFQVLSEPFIEKYFGKLDWYFVFSYQNLS